ncbi:alpha-ketoacid dehydrogenase subunit beta [Microbulbifer thermotolerans]|uniref:2-oxoisovalerate dehydrogenase subunit beta n=1 Tax=Microbulbifer thermotolerans TaxID=252514 RepID=A0A143HR89_MICTH|nr:alpha-ketoacid dehydrogenase subunit beta [Microbulbifer thermotolerans]AMX03920.1 2-oxoisovalerate dehydrogenase [Microbulbifer thermotolerans]MCX2782893.1 alpha-ketoacid dehydrogenase subunit beta [Microbulbifer thermotolerans]MCX2794036.1 alpha-ketoacid dehydrogenase subunit beta [Microbulbifer thermotolerans]MCX2833372.1 alpha-ketoacid dehydrogenase subunit beta [Microbulbifer thermotolerans]SFC16666.1 pyruvate dehydrogenase E1 component beta subunit [Microbulbifer thermotolerans]
MAQITLVEAVTQALAYEMHRDPRVVVFGEDVGANGGVFRATDGLQKTFGPDRVLDTPLAENMIAGIAVGMAAQGLRPVGEFQFMGFIYPGLDQILSHAARFRNRTRGRLSCPVVYRAPYGGGIHAPEHHSESFEALFAHIPGLRVVVPSSPARAYGLLLAAIRDPDPVIFLEPKRIYRAATQEVPDDGEALPLDRCFVLREGSDITLISWGASLKETLQAAEQLAGEGVEAEVLDPATLKPLDIHSIIDSLEKTRRCVVVHEAPRSGGLGAEIVAQINEYAFDLLEAPVQRVTGYDTVMPYYQLEHVYLPDVEGILAGVRAALDYRDGGGQ